MEAERREAAAEATKALTATIAAAMAMGTATGIVRGTAAAVRVTVTEVAAIMADAERAALTVTDPGLCL